MRSRCEWGALTSGEGLQVMATSVSGSDPGNTPIGPVMPHASMRAGNGRPALARDLWIPVTLALLAFTVYWAIGLHFVDAMGASYGPGPLGSNVRTSARDFLQLKYEWKHPLMSPIDFGLTSLFGMLPVLGRLQAIVAAVATLAAANVLLVYVVLRPLVSDRPTAALGAAVYGITFVDLCVLSVPESYAVSSFFILLFLLAWLKLGERNDLRARLLLGIL